MNELFELYTESKDINNVEEIKKEVENINSTNLGGLDQLARYAINDGAEMNILIELDVSQLKEEPTVFMTAYEYAGDIENYSCENEIGCKEFNYNWANLKNEMTNFAKELMIDKE